MYVSLTFLFLFEGDFIGRYFTHTDNKADGTLLYSTPQLQVSTKQLPVNC